MSGITGIFRRDGRDVDPADIKKMNDKISHRGPDGSQVWCEGPVAFGHQMLHTTQESLHEILPFEDEESGLVITADARIDNRKDLAPLLGIEDNEYVSDSYFILKAYEKWGEKCPEELLGDFAFAIWDKNKEKLFCARDHMGVKPFYYYLSEDLFVFGTEIKTLFTNKKIPFELNYTKISYYLMFEHFDKILTFYKNIMRMPPASLVEINNEKFSIKKYWVLDPDLKIKMDSEQDYINRFNEIFSESVNCRLRSAFDLGFELSGGLDSSSIVCMARKIFSNKSLTKNYVLNTFSYTFKEIPQFSELKYIKFVTDKGRINHQFVYGDDIDLMYNDKVYYYLEQPVDIPYMKIKWEFYEKIKKNNVKVLLSGAGGDATISHGKFYLKDLFSSLKFKKFVQELKIYSELVNRNFFQVFWANVFLPILPLNMKILMNFLLFNHKKGYKSILNETFKKKNIGNDYYEYKKSHKTAIESAKNFHYYELNDFDSQSNLEFVNKVSSAFEIELRYPFLDKRLIEFCFGIPDELKFKFGWGRYLQRISLENILPDGIRWRHSKTDFTPIIERNFLLFGKDSIEEILYEDDQILSSFVNMDIIKKKYQNYYFNLDYTWRDIHDIWLTLNIYYLFNHKEWRYFIN